MSVSILIIVLQFTKRQDRDIIRVYKNSFHVSGKPGRHQWIQSAYIAGSACCAGVSNLPCLVVYNEVCAAFLYSDILVIFMKYTWNFIDLVTFDAIANSLLSVPTFSGIEMLSIGVVSFAHFIPFGLFQSILLFHAFPYMQPLLVHFNYNSCCSSTKSLKKVSKFYPPTILKKYIFIRSSCHLNVIIRNSTWQHWFVT